MKFVDFDHALPEIAVVAKNQIVGNARVAHEKKEEHSDEEFLPNHFPTTQIIGQDLIRLEPLLGGSGSTVLFHINRLPPDD